MSWVQSIDTIYSRIFGGAFALVVLWETFSPARPLRHPTLRRWCANALLFASCKISAFILGSAAIFLSVAVSQSPYGLLNRTSTPYWLRLVAGLLLLDLFRYGRHYLMHSSEFLWRFHQVHHSDEDYDLTTGFRFHPGEGLLADATDLLFIAILAPAPLAVVISQCINVFLNFFNHGNMAFPAWAERYFRKVLVSPGLHRIHHATNFADQNANYGVMFPWWDRLFGTYAARTSRPEEAGQTGLEELSGVETIHTSFLLFLPFRRAAAVPVHAENPPLIQIPQ